MPKLVNPEARRREIVEALFRIAVREGLQHASLRKVADEAALNIGSVRHYFQGHQELMRFAMRAMMDRVSARMDHRIQAVPDPATLPGAQRRTLILGVLEELLPLDETRRDEVVVWLEFVTAARTSPELGPLAREAASSVRSLVRRVLAAGSERGLLRTRLDLDAETARLVGLLDGLSIDAVLHPEVVDAESCRAALHRHLDELAETAG